MCGEVLASASSVARVYNVGPREASAIVQLSQKVTEPIQALLKDSVRKRGMRVFLTHEGIGKEIFSLAWSSGSGQYEAWNDALTNKDDNELVSSLNLLRYRPQHGKLCQFDISNTFTLRIRIADS